MSSSKHLADDAIGERLRAARVAAGQTQEEVGAALGLARTTVVAIENGTRKVRPEELVSYARLLGLNIHALLRDERTVDFTAQFRRQQSSREGRRPKLLQESIDAERLLQRLASSYLSVEQLLGRPLRYDYPPEVRLLRGGVASRAEDAAIELRARLGLGLRPIQDLVGLAEGELSMRVFERPLPSAIAGAFAYDDYAGACVLVNGNHPRERRAWTLAHEMGHFLSARRVGDVLTLEESEHHREQFSDAFAAALLMPAAAVRDRFADVCEGEGKFSARSLVYLARAFHVSVEAMARRLERLSLLPQGTYAALRERGFSVKLVDQVEPAAAVSGGLLLPAPQRFNMLVAEAYAKGLLSEGQCAASLVLDRVAVRELLEALGGEEDLAAAHG